MVIFEDGRAPRIFSHHADLLSDGHCHDAFDVCRILEHGGDWTAAVKAAARDLDMALPTVSEKSTGRSQHVVSVL